MVSRTETLTNCLVVSTTKMWQNWYETEVDKLLYYSVKQFFDSNNRIIIE